MATTDNALGLGTDTEDESGETIGLDLTKDLAASLVILLTEAHAKISANLPNVRKEALICTNAYKKTQILQRAGLMEKLLADSEHLLEESREIFEELNDRKPKSKIITDIK